MYYNWCFRHFTAANLSIISSKLIDCVKLFSIYRNYRRDPASGMSAGSFLLFLMPKINVHLPYLQQARSDIYIYMSHIYMYEE